MRAQLAVNEIIRRAGLTLAPCAGGKCDVKQSRRFESLCVHSPACPAPPSTTDELPVDSDSRARLIPPRPVSDPHAFRICLAMLAPSHRASREEPEAPRAPVATRRTEAAAECDARASPPPSLPPGAPPLSPPPSPPTSSAPSAVAAASSRPAPGARGAIGPEPAAGGGRFSLRDDGLRLPRPPHMHAAGCPRLDLSTPLEACGAIRVALLPVGAIDAASFRRYARLCAAHASQLELAEITHGQARVSVRVGLRVRGRGRGRVR